jgi:hypothetical protein
MGVQIGRAQGPSLQLAVVSSDSSVARLALRCAQALGRKPIVWDRPKAPAIPSIRVEGMILLGVSL